MTEDCQQSYKSEQYQAQGVEYVLIGKWSILIQDARLISLSVHEIIGGYCRQRILPDYFAIL